MADKRVCEGYEVIKSHRVGKVEVVLAYNPNPKVPQQYVTWKAYAHTKFKDFAYGRYFNDRASAERVFTVGWMRCARMPDCRPSKRSSRIRMIWNGERPQRRLPF